MRAPLLFIVGALAGCGGNWSVGDLVFASVLPWTEDLVVRLPASTTTQPLEGVSTRRDGLMVGEPSVAWAQTRKAAGDVNGLLTQVLGFVEQVRAVAPTTRAETSRIWGPYSDVNNPGREVQLRVTMVAELRFEWTIESRATGGDFVRITSGTITSSGETARSGSGVFMVFVKDFRELVTVTSSISQLDEIGVSYGLGSGARVHLVPRAGAAFSLSELGYTTSRGVDGSGSLFFVSTPDEGGRQWELLSLWSSTGAGRATGVVRTGTPLEGRVTECWNAGGAVTHYAEAWDGGVVAGQPSDCVVTEGP